MKLISTLKVKMKLCATMIVLATAGPKSVVACPQDIQRVFWNKFETVVNADNSVTLNWNVTEYNNKSFQIQHSINGSDWTPVAVIESKNSAESMVDYTFTHQNKNAGKQFYRIQETDLDMNSLGYSPVRTLMLEKKEVTTSTIWPNPASHHIIVKNKENEQTYSRARIFDMTGKVVAQRSLDSHTNSITIHDLPTGAYIVQLEDDKGGRLSHKIFKQ